MKRSTKKELIYDLKDMGRFTIVLAMVWLLGLLIPDIITKWGVILLFICYSIIRKWEIKR